MAEHHQSNDRVAGNSRYIHYYKVCVVTFLTRFTVNSMTRFFWTTLCCLFCIATLAADQHAGSSYTHVVTPQPTSVVLTISPASATASAPVTLAAQVAGRDQNTAPPPGTVTFQIVDQAQNTQTLLGQLANGATSVSATVLAGTYSVSAMYNGSANFGTSSSSAALSVAADDPPQSGTPDFSFSLAGSTSVAQGSSGSVQTTITGINGFTGNVTLSCSNLPTQMTCVFSPATVTASASAVQSTLTLSTIGSTVTVASTGLIAFGLFLLPVRCGPDRRRQQKLRLLGLFAVIVFNFGLFACGGRLQYTQTDGTSMGTYNVQVTATSGSISHSNTLTVTVN